MTSFVPQAPLASLGGTFDPLHIGHLRVALEAADALGGELRLMPASVPPHREQPVATAAQRVAILRAGLSGQHRLRLDERELSRAGPSYTIDTLMELRDEIGSDRSLVLLLGRDAFCGLPNWHCWRALFNYAHIGVLSRPGHPLAMPDELASEVSSRFISPASLVGQGAFGQVFEIAVSALEISATAIRELLGRGGDPRYLLPDAVVDDASLLKPYSNIRSGDAIDE